MQPGDDGDLQRGRGVNFLTLDFNNGFGNTNRFTDDLLEIKPILVRLL
jgi:hypothetical protein